MSSKLIHVAIAFGLSRPGRVKENLREIQGFARQAKDDGADILLTPEMSASGYGGYPEVFAVAEEPGKGAIFDGLAGIAVDSGVVVCAGFLEKAGDKHHIAHYVVYPDGRWLTVEKHLIAPPEKPIDPLFPLTPDGSPTKLRLKTFKVKDVQCGLLICADSGIAGAKDRLEGMGVELFLLPTAAGGSREDRVTTHDLRTSAGRKKYLEQIEKVFFPGTGVTECIEHRWAQAAVNQCGADGHGLFHAGHGTIITPLGEVPALIHGIPNIDRMRPMYTHAAVDVLARVYCLDPEKHDH